MQKFISENIGVLIAELYDVSTFYSQFTITPRGKHHIGVCLGTACYVRGAQKTGFDRVFDTNFTADLTILEEGTKLLSRVTTGGKLPMITSCVRRDR